MSFRFMLWIPLSLISAYFFPYQIDWIILTLISLIFPVLLIIQALWATKFSIVVTDIIKGYEHDYETYAFGSLLTITIVSFFGSIFMIVQLLIQELTVQTASYISVLSTIIIICLIVNVLFPIEPVSTICMIIFFSVFMAKVGINSIQVYTEDDYNSSILVMLMKSFFGSANSDTSQLAISQIFSFDFIISFILSIASIITYPFLYLYNPEDNLYRTLRNPFKEENINRNVLKILVSSILVLGYINIILNVTGNQSGQYYMHVIQSFLPLTFFFFYFKHKYDEE